MIMIIIEQVFDSQLTLDPKLSYLNFYLLNVVYPTMLSG